MGSSPRVGETAVPEVDPATGAPVDNEAHRQYLAKQIIAERSRNRGGGGHGRGSAGYSTSGSGGSGFSSASDRSGGLY